MSASSGPTTRRSSWRSRSTAATSRPARTASDVIVARAGVGPGDTSHRWQGERVPNDIEISGGIVPVLELRGLCKNFGGLQATREVSLRSMPGDRKAIIGPNGAGKTTLFNLITGIYPITSGQVLLFGKDVTGWQSHRRTAMGMS